ncbi:unnamed protein product, partial [Mesorhabditis belari]|uniref:Iron-binding zinc finger CDGSH type domain-containing protein n=1 Tax=Mesorhabditis belari TaxID=2138241 RepID=A0AAF3FP21_9BILA
MFLRTLPQASGTLQKTFTRGAAKGIKIETPLNDALPFKGIDAAKKPKKVALDAGKSYTWCSCGLSTSQPFCDGSHKLDGLTTCRPVRFQVEKSGEYQMCMCKQTDHRPLCDGKHKNVSPIPRDAPTQGLFNIAFSDNSPVYEGVAKKLGYRPKNGGFQW